MLTQNKTVLLFNPHIAESFKSEVTRLVKDEALRRQLGCAAAQAAKDAPYTWDGNAVRITSLADSLMKKTI